MHIPWTLATVLFTPNRWAFKSSNVPTVSFHRQFLQSECKRVLTSIHYTRKKDFLSDRDYKMTCQSLLNGNIKKLCFAADFSRTDYLKLPMARWLCHQCLLFIAVDTLNEINKSSVKRSASSAITVKAKGASIDQRMLPNASAPALHPSIGCLCTYSTQYLWTLMMLTLRKCLMYRRAMRNCNLIVHIVRSEHNLSFSVASTLYLRINKASTWSKCY